MAKRINWLPVNHQKFHDLVNRIVNYIADTANRERMDFGTTTRNGKYFVEVFLPEVAAYLPVYTAWEDPAERTRVKQLALEKAEEALRPRVRYLYMNCLKNSVAVTDTDLAAMSLPVPSGERHHSPVAKRAPGFRFEQLDGHRVEVDFFDIESDSKRGKPAGQHGIEFKLGVFDDNLPASPEELTESVFDTNPPYVFEGTARQQGKFLKLFGRWENTRGEKGPWSELFIVVIP